MICSLIMRRNCIDRAHKKGPLLKAGRERKKTDRYPVIYHNLAGVTAPCLKIFSHAYSITFPRQSQE